MGNGAWGLVIEHWFAFGLGFTIGALVSGIFGVFACIKDKALLEEHYLEQLDAMGEALERAENAYRDRLVGVRPL